MRSLTILQYLSINKAQTNLAEISFGESQCGKDFAVCRRDEGVAELTGKARDGSRSEYESGNRSFIKISTRQKHENWLAEKVGIDPLNAELCTALHSLVWELETKHLSEFRLPLDFIDMF